MFKLDGQDMWKLERERDDATTTQLEKHIPFLIDSYINNVAPSAEVDAKIRDDYKKSLSYASKIEELKDIITEGLGSGFTVIGVDSAEGYVVGSIETVIGNEPEFEYKDFKRYAKLEDYSKHQDILPMLTMHKVREQEAGAQLYRDYFEIPMITNPYGRNNPPILDDFTGIFKRSSEIFNFPLNMMWLILPNVESV